MKIKYLSLIIIALTLSLSLNLLFGWQALAQIQAQGTLDSPDTPANTFSYTLEDLYNRLTGGTAGSQTAFTEPASGPTTATMHSLNEIMDAAPALDNTNGATAPQLLADKTAWGLTGGQWGVITGTMPNNGAGSTIVPTTTNQTIALGYWSSANTVQGDSNLTATNIVSGAQIFGVTGTYPLAAVPKTGITVCYDDNGNSSIEIPCAGTGQDGEFQMGVTPPTPRFVDNGDGTVTDNLTRLIWLQDQTCPSLSVSTGAYDAMLAAATTLQDGQCGLTDGSSPGDWRHPNIYELISVLGVGPYSGLNQALPAPFTSSNGFFGVLGAPRLSSTPCANNTVYATQSGKIEPRAKTDSLFGWAVRGGQ